MERDLIGWSWQETQLHLEDEQRSGTGVFEEMTVDQIIANATEDALELNGMDAQSNIYKDDDTVTSLASTLFDRLYNPNNKIEKQVYIDTFLEVYQSN